MTETTSFDAYTSHPRFEFELLVTRSAGACAACWVLFVIWNFRFIKVGK